MHFKHQLRRSIVRRTTVICIACLLPSLAGHAQTSAPTAGSAADPHSEDSSRGIAPALHLQQTNHINAAVLALEAATRQPTGHPAWWRQLNPEAGSDLRAADPSAVYRDAGMDWVSLWTAARAINTEYAHYAPHLLLANTHAPFRDPRRVDQRADTLWMSEYLIANLLAPADAGIFSPWFAQPESLHFHGRPPFAVNSTTEYWSNGSWRQSGAVDGATDQFSYAVGADYRSEQGYRRNHDFEQRILSFKTRGAITDRDTLFLQVSSLDSDAGDLLHYYKPSSAQPNRRVTEEQEPIVLVGYHHEWSPQSHTLVLAGRLHERVGITDPDQPVILVERDAMGHVLRGPLGLYNFNVPLPMAPLSYEREFESYVVEVQQIFEWEKHGLQLGARFLDGTVDARSVFGPSTPSFLVSPGSTSAVAVASSPATDRMHGDYQRYGAYAYHQWQVTDSWRLAAGVTYEHLRNPVAFLNPPAARSEESISELSPKGGFVWTPGTNTTLRAMYSQVLGSVSIDQDYRLEPSQVVGFNQGFRNVVPQSITEGPLAGPTFDTWMVSFEQRLWRRTFFGVLGEVHTSEKFRRTGAFDVTAAPGPSSTTSVPEEITYSERDLTLSLNQLVGDCTVLGAHYRVVDADQARFRGNTGRDTDIGSTLHQIGAYGLLNHPSGFFARAQALWSQQSNRAYVINPPGDEFWHFDLFLGYRFPNRQAEIKVGLLNLTDENYRIAPLNLTSELPRERTLVASLKFAF